MDAYGVIRFVLELFVECRSRHSCPIDKNIFDVDKHLIEAKNI